MVKIGVILNENDQITSLIDAVRIAIYEKKDSDWIETNEVKECFGQRNSMNQMRDFLEQMIAELKECNILVASILTGIPYMILDKAGFMLCEADIITNQLFEEVAYDYVKMQQEKEQLQKMPVTDYPTKPYETKEKGIFELDMQKLQKSHPDISSKKAIIPFLNSTNFYQLNIYCSHIMPWLDRELAKLGMGYQSYKLNEQGYRLEITNCCK